MIAEVAWISRNWGLVLPVCVFLVSSIIFFWPIRPRTTKGGRGNEEALSWTEKLALGRVASELSALVWNQKVALQLVYRRPRLSLEVYVEQLLELGFGYDCDPKKAIMEPLTETSLVAVDNQTKVGPSAYPAVARRVEKFLREQGVGF